MLVAPFDPRADVWTPLVYNGWIETSAKRVRRGTVARKSLIGGPCVCAGGLTF